MKSWRHGVLLMLTMMNIQSALLLAQDHDLPNHFYELSKTFPEHVIYKGSGSSRSLALTFDDGPAIITEDMLDILDTYEVKATFFWQGSNLVQFPDLINRALKAGHEIANHSWDHPDGTKLEPYQLWKTQIAPTISQYNAHMDKAMDLYRPPFGGITHDQVALLKDQGITTVLWSHSTMDWDTERNSCQNMDERFRSGLHPGAIVLMHDMDFDDSATEKLCAIQKIIEYATDQGYAFQTVSEMMQTSN